MRTGSAGRPARVVIVGWLVVVALGACGPTGAPATAGSPTDAAAGGTALTILAAASLRPAFERLRERYRATHSGVNLTLAVDASSAHRARIEQGLPADVFASADIDNPQALVDGGFAIGPPRVFAGNRLAIVTPSDDPGHVAAPADLARAGVRVVAAGDTVPITRYATDCLGRLAKLPGYPPDYAARVAANIVSREDDVAAVVAKIQLGEGDAAIVYATDAARSPTLRVIDIPAAANVVASYAAVVLTASRQPAEAAAFLDWLAGPEARAELRSFGFTDPT